MTVREFVSAYENLHKQCSYYCRHLGHLKGLIENDDWVRVVDGSTSGRVLLLGNSEVINALVLFNTRMFDTGKDTISIHRLARYLPDETEIERHHKEIMGEIGFEYELKRHYTARCEFIQARRRLVKDNPQRALRSLRDYTLAHNIEPETEPRKATLNDLVHLTEAVNELVDLAGYVVRGSRSVYRDFADKAERETKMLYAALPKLTDIETA